jgi:hypothetical protein
MHINFNPIVFFRRGGLGYGLHFLFVNVITFNKNVFVFQLAHIESLEEVSWIINRILFSLSFCLDTTASSAQGQKNEKIKSLIILLRLGASLHS